MTLDIDIQTSLQLALSTWTVSFGSSSYAGGLKDIMHDLRVSDSVAILGISLYVMGFALGYAASIYASLVDRF